MIEFKNISFGYSPRQKIYSDLSLGFDGGNNGSVYGLLGGNGVGKSTLLKLAAGLLSPQGGSVAIDGINPAGRVPELYRRLMMVPEEFDLPATTVEEFTRTTAPFYPDFSHEAWRKYVKALEIDPTWHFRRLLSEATVPGRTIVISTHQARDVENLLDHIVILGKKGIVVDASVSSVEDGGQKFDLEEFYIKSVKK